MVDVKSVVKVNGIRRTNTFINANDNFVVPNSLVLIFDGTLHTKYIKTVPLLNKNQLMVCSRRSSRQLAITTRPNSARKHH